jgi:hypothetical protein
MSGPRASAPLPERDRRAIDRWALRDALDEYGALSSSLGISISEAAHRGSDAVAILHVKQARRVVQEMEDVCAKLEAISVAEAAERKRPNGASAPGGAP